MQEKERTPNGEKALGMKHNKSLSKHGLSEKGIKRGQIDRSKMWTYNENGQREIEENSERSDSGTESNDHFVTCIDHQHEKRQDRISRQETYPTIKQECDNKPKRSPRYHKQDKNEKTWTYDEKGRRETQENSNNSTSRMDKGSGMENPKQNNEGIQEHFKRSYSGAESNEHLCTLMKLQHEKRQGRFPSQEMHTAIKQEVVSSEESEKGGTYLSLIHI